MKTTSYVRRVGAGEARDGTIMVLKDRLDFFPPVGQPFHLVHDGRHLRARVQAVRCTCRGPEAPHEHYFIRWKGLAPGDRISLIRDAKADDTYVVWIERPQAA